MALELDCCVLALSQLTDDGKLRESRAIAQDADHNLETGKPLETGSFTLVQPIKLHIEKCRDGSTGTVPLTFMRKQ